MYIKSCAVRYISVYNRGFNKANIGNVLSMHASYVYSYILIEFDGSRKMMDHKYIFALATD